MGGNVILLTAAVFNMHASFVLAAGRPPEQIPQLGAQYINQVIAKVEKLLMVGSGNTDAKYEVFEPHLDAKPPSRQRRRRRRRRRRHLLDGPPDLSLELPAFGHTLRLDLDQSESLISNQFQLLEEGEFENSTRRRRDVSGRDEDVVLPDASCFYQGRVRGVPGSKAALSVCAGLRGLIETPNSTFLVYPLDLSGGTRTVNASSPHILVKGDGNQTQQCAHYERSSRQNNVTRTARGPEQEATDELKYRPRSRRRQRRALRSSRGDRSAVVETAVFVDQALYQAMTRAFPGNTDQELVTYVLTIMNAVQMLFKHDSLGRSMDVTVVELEILKLQPRDLVPSENIDTYLTNFCVWQHQRRRSVSQGMPRWDHALLLSGINMFVVDERGTRKRHVVGLAPVSGMCNSLNSCTISEGTSFQSVYVASHEMGHSLGMEHDGVQDGNPCDVDNFVMSPTLGAGKTTWSACSRQYMAKFLRSQAAVCVFQQASLVNLLGPKSGLPGEQFTADQQCALRFGSSSRKTSHQSLQETCRMLRCEMSRGLTPVSFAAHPALEGTPCGEGKWCKGGNCVARKDELERRRSRDPPVDGGWGPWSAFGSCRSDCVGRDDFAYVGVKVSRRRCDRPSPQNGGKFCEGSDKRVQICDASQICTASTPQRLLEDFLQSICSQASLRDTTIEPYGTQFPSRDYSHSCYVWCRKRVGGYMTHGWRIPEGTPCWSLSQRRDAHKGNRYCVDGECQAFDCYGRSTAEDTDETECPRQSMTMVARAHGVPAGWGPWHPVSECRHSCLVDGTGFQLVSRECNSISRCSGKRENFKLCDSTRKCRGMVTADQYATKICEKYHRKYPSLLSGKGRQLPRQPGNPHVACVVACQDRVWKDTHYQMDVFEEGRFPFGTDCSGRRGSAYCVSGRCQRFSHEGTPLEEEAVQPRPPQRERRRRRTKRSAHDRAERHSGQQQQLWRRPLSLGGPMVPLWWLQTNQTWARVSPFAWKVIMSDCTLPCGGGTRNTSVHCQVLGNRVSDDLCDPALRPTMTMGVGACNTEPCSGRWHTEPWSPCSRSCGSPSHQSRVVACLRPLTQTLFSLVHDSNCPRPEPPRLRKCYLPPCPGR